MARTGEYSVIEIFSLFRGVSIYSVVLYTKYCGVTSTSTKFYIYFYLLFVKESHFIRLVN